MKHIKEIIEERYDENAVRWLCDSCGEGKEYLSQIAGTNVKQCEVCGSTKTLIRKYKW